MEQGQSSNGKICFVHLHSQSWSTRTMSISIFQYFKQCANVCLHIVATVNQSVSACFCQRLVNPIKDTTHKEALETFFSSIIFSVSMTRTLFLANETKPKLFGFYLFQIIEPLKTSVALNHMWENLTRNCPSNLYPSQSFSKNLLISLVGKKRTTISDKRSTPNPVSCWILYSSTANAICS